MTALATTTRHVAALDGLRALAVLAVLASHYLPWHPLLVSAGPQGVRLFFVLSGFLITGILLRGRAAVTIGHQGLGFTLRQFYARRFLRIFPLYYATLAMMWVADVGAIRDTIGWHAAYLSNLLFARTGEWGSATAHFWSLALEEQFYLVWPFVVLLLARRRLVAVLVALVAAAFLWRFASSVAGLPAMVRWMVPLHSLDSLALGSLLAVGASPIVAAHVGTAHGVGTAAPNAESSGASAPRWLRLGAWGAALLSLPAVIVAWGFVPATPVAARAASASLDLITSWLFAALVWWAAHARPAGFARLLTSAPLTGLGRISYGVYVLHLLGGYAVSLAAVQLGVALPRGSVWHAVAATGLTIAAAAASWRWFERPINARKELFPYLRRQAVGGRAGRDVIVQAGVGRPPEPGC